MYCTNCGAAIMAGNKFCTGCGAKVGSKPAAAQAETKTERKAETPKAEPAARMPATVAIPVQIRTGMIKTQAGILLIGRPHSALLRFDNKQYQQIVASGNRGGNYFQKVAGMMAAFGEYAEALAKRPVAEVAAEQPGSALFEDAQIRKLKIWNGWDAKREQYDDFYSFELTTTGDKYKGTVDKNVEAAAMKARLRGVLGSRFG